MSESAKCQDCDSPAIWYREAADRSPNPVGFCNHHIKQWRGGFSRIWRVENHPPCIECGEKAVFMTTMVCEISGKDGDIIESSEYGDPRGFCSDDCHARWAFRNGSEMVKA